MEYTQTKTQRVEELDTGTEVETSNVGSLHLRKEAQRRLTGRGYRFSTWVVLYGAGGISWGILFGFIIL